MEPQLNTRFGDYLADYLRSGFAAHQLANTYNTFSNALEQMLTLVILVRRLAGDEQHRLHDRHARRLPDVRQPPVPTDAAAGRLVAGIPAGQHCGATPG